MPAALASKWRSCDRSRRPPRLEWQSRQTRHCHLRLVLVILVTVLAAPVSVTNGEVAAARVPIPQTPKVTVNGPGAVTKTPLTQNKSRDPLSTFNWSLRFRQALDYSTRRIELEMAELQSGNARGVASFDVVEQNWTIRDWQAGLEMAQGMQRSGQNGPSGAPNQPLDVPISVDLNASNISAVENLIFLLPPPTPDPNQPRASLLLNDSALRMNNLKTLAFYHSGVEFISPAWLPSNQHLAQLTMGNCLINQTAGGESGFSIGTVEIIDSAMDHFPYELLFITSARLVMRNVNITEAVIMNASHLEKLRSINFIAKNVNVLEQSHPCTPSPILNTDLEGCVTESSAVSRPKTSNKGDQSSESKSNSRMTTAGIVLGVLGGLVLVVGGFIIVRHRTRMRSKEPEDSYMVSPSASDSVNMQTNLLTGTATETKDKIPVMGETGVLGELEIPQEEVVVGQRLGTHGLWRAEYLNTKVVMLKVLTDQSSKTAMQEFNRAVLSFVNLRHSNVMLFIGLVRCDHSEIGVLVEHMQKGSLRSLLANPQVDLSWKQRLRIAQDLCRGLTFVQSVKTGRSLSPNLCAQRVFCDEEYNCKLNIFDYGMPLKESITPLLSYGIGIMAYRAPEDLVSGQPSNQSQIYALGVIFCELSSQVQPYHEVLVEHGWTLAEVQIAQGVASGAMKPDISGDAPEAFQDLTTRCLSFDPKDRPSLSEISMVLAEL